MLRNTSTSTSTSVSLCLTWPNHCSVQSPLVRLRAADQVYGQNDANHVRGHERFMRVRPCHTTTQLPVLDWHAGTPNMQTPWTLYNRCAWWLADPSKGNVLVLLANLLLSTGTVLHSGAAVADFACTLPTVRRSPIERALRVLSQRMDGPLHLRTTRKSTSELSRPSVTGFLPAGNVQ